MKSKSPSTKEHRPFQRQNIPLGRSTTIVSEHCGASSSRELGTPETADVLRRTVRGSQTYNVPPAWLQNEPAQPRQLSHTA
eukprot:CAMPEP_0114563384 /NCGR_PEP_ID=MMETSP0114-20121206/13074_1 /TAXON_ID=31324 /ORGANISM="Goniomonas sp, Strain m" /LENGTH=80 /DNA_ID=CAMNT_0001749213 /DNA_START=546 /DNA_END=785 /DNA_ORIENTATION=-